MPHTIAVYKIRICVVRLCVGLWIALICIGKCLCKRIYGMDRIDCNLNTHLFVINRILKYNLHQNKEYMFVVCVQYPILF